MSYTAACVAGLPAAAAEPGTIAATATATAAAKPTWDPARIGAIAGHVAPDAAAVTFKVVTGDAEATGSRALRALDRDVTLQTADVARFWPGSRAFTAEMSSGAARVAGGRSDAGARSGSVAGLATIKAVAAWTPSTNATAEHLV